MLCVICILKFDFLDTDGRIAHDRTDVRNICTRLAIFSSDFWRSYFPVCVCETDQISEYPQSELNAYGEI